MNRRLLSPLLALLAGVAFATSANAAVTANNVVTAQNPNRGGLQFLNANTAGTYLTFYAAGPNGSICKGIHVNNNDITATHIITIQQAMGSSTTASIAASTASVTGSITGTVMNVTAVSSGILIPGETLSGTSVTAGTQIVNQINGNPGGVGNYNVTVASTATSTTISGTYGTMTVTAVTANSGIPTVGQLLAGASVAAGSVVIGYGTAGPGTTGIGTYYVSPTGTTSSTTITGTAPFSSQPAKMYGGANLTTTLAATATSFVDQAVTSVPGTAGSWSGLPIDSDGNAFLQLNVGDSIAVTYATAVTSPDQVDVLGTCADF